MTPLPHTVRENFLPPDVVSNLLDYVRDNEPRFTPSTVRNAAEPAVNTAVRVSSLLRDLGPFQALFETLLAPLVAALAEACATPPFAASKFELEIAAHNEGAFFLRHIDTYWDAATRSQRVLSGVYYFHAQPKGFDGGALRLHGGERFADVAPLHNSFVFFPSWLAHEVMPVRCASRRFGDSRFAVNCWIHRAAS